MNNQNHDLKRLLEELKQNLPDWKNKGFIPRSGWNLLAENGIIGIASDSEDGMGEFYEICRMLMEADDYGLIASYAINEIGYNLVHNLGDMSHKNTIDDIKKGNKNVALCISEENAGSDMLAMETGAASSNGSYVLNGTKIFVSNGPIADLFIVAARTRKDVEAWRGISLFLAENADNGLSRSARIETAGANLMPIGEIRLQDCIIPQERLLGRKDRGFQHLLHVLDFERTVIAIIAVCGCEMIMKNLTPYLESRMIFGKRLGDYQSAKVTVAKYYAQTHVARTFVEKVVKSYAEGNCNRNNVIMAKWVSTELIKEFASVATQLHGGRGFMSYHWSANLHNDVRWMCIGGGANELLLDVLGDDIICRG